MMNKAELITTAMEMRDKAYVPYSRFPVGAALLSDSGKIYTGCNIENAAYPVSCCAERVAIFQAIADGERHFSAMAVAADTNRPVPPCGSCRQVMSEFFDPFTVVYLANLAKETKTFKMNELLPFSFDPDDLIKK